MSKISIVAKVFLVIVGLAFLNVAVQAFINPQTVMDFVSVKLENTSARNSTRAFYGGVNLTFALFLIYGAFKMQKEALILASLYGGGFVIGRLYSILMEGQPSTFILTWLTIESFLTLGSLILLIELKKQKLL
ncbi:DUF4345 domain-containing protein [Lacihabitans soyangensis]|uniref:DUF4345 domain-containing protein n=1 Tax=Lacihabitans soyangensis TaxID=869394 RepID=A0AAE3GYX2_9BACT|nr:DUF4345 domain-containing protein [Lacihabitans soyangensis]MCP9761607.1 DUF4345 domain-containing protein [Lacihabitans soyangensis]